MASKFEEAIPMASTGPQPHVVVMATDDAETTPSCCCCDDGCEEENEERGNWSCNFESTLACISYGIGPGYLWMVPDGYSRQGGGIGIGMVAMTAILSIYYNGVMAQVLYYLFYVTGDLHTATSCDNPWNTENCYTSMCGKVVEYYGDDKMYNYTYTTCGHMSAASEYLDHYVLQRPDVRGYMGAVRGDLAGCLFLASLLLMAALSFGIKSLGKVAYVTTILPLFLLFLLFLRAVTLPGASDGIAYAMTPGPVWVAYVTTILPLFLLFLLFLRAVTLPGASDGIAYAMTPGPVWDASFGSGLISAVVLRLTLGFGGYTTLASYNRFHNNVLRDAIVVVFVELLVMIFCVLTMAGLYGYLANIGGVDIRDMIWSGTTMLFVTMVSGFSQLPSGSSWAALFFLCVFLLAFGCQITYLETVITSLMDLIPRRLIKRMPGKESGLLSKRTMLHGVMTVAVCFLFFLLGLPYVTQVKGKPRDIVQPPTDWGPYLNKHRKGVA
uniref:Uncharacterized protein n=1 Tax=Branchiostoma floridae TaxID=7739 RepID=C3ZPK5_BRAFL|eukprot:XP_002589491.1 hypothetical protein BRAFLDRAFT_88350 [Branchiostoma floridae]